MMHIFTFVVCLLSLHHGQPGEHFLIDLLDFS